MRKKVLLAALSALALTACVNDETIEMNPGNAVAFRPSTENSTRATVTTSNTIQDFKVWGYYKKNDNTDYTSFMEEQVVNKAGNEWVYSPVRFWPTSGEVDFYSVSPASVETNITKDAQQIVDYTVDTDPSKQIDLLYAVNMECKKSSEGVPVNFRHALSQVVFKAKTANPNIEVQIESIKLNNIMGKGTFTFPKKTTTAITQSNTYEDAAEDETFGTWTLSTNASDLQYPTIEFDTKTVPTDGTTIDLTSVADGTAMLLMPQVLAENNYTYDYEGGSTTVQVSPTLSISCKIYNVSGEDKVQVFGSSNHFSTLRNIPFEGTWQQGRKYTYTLIFGEEMNNLKKVNFEASVDEFQSPLNENTNIQQPLEGIDMNQNEVYGGGNCFVIPKSDTETIRYYFDPTKEGQTDDPIGTTAKASDHARKAWLMHEDTKGMLTDIAYYPEEQKIAFNIEKGKTGNAIVAITDGVDNVLWSWHIWVVDDNAFMTETESGDYMDRNMGAISKAARNGNTQDIGVYYQYGRHTPALMTYPNSHSGFLLDYDAFLQSSHKFILSNDKTEWIGPNGDNLSKTLWEKKNLSKYSPLPKGWTLPNSNTFINWLSQQEKETVTTDGFALVIKDKEGNDVQTFYGNSQVNSRNGTITVDTYEIHYYGTSPNVIQIDKRGTATLGNFEYRAQGYCIRPVKE